LCSALLCSTGPLGVLAMRSASRSSHSPLCFATALPLHPRADIPPNPPPRKK
jgi:hypothetical protein